VKEKMIITPPPTKQRKKTLCEDTGCKNYDITVFYLPAVVLINNSQICDDEQTMISQIWRDGTIIFGWIVLEAADLVVMDRQMFSKLSHCRRK
jgi:hypothetical protein